MKKSRQTNVDTRGVAIYARKSRITNKGDSIGVQFKQCADYARRELNLEDDYQFMEYEDKGLSGYFSDRPDYQRMLRDVQDGKIRAIVCYKLDRIGRKTTDLLHLMDFLEMYHADLLICSNGINTASGFSKIFIQLFAVIAEFERDTLTERITDNMMELAKDGRWLGGNTPMGFAVQRVSTGSGKGKSAYSYLISVPEEKQMVQRLYELFRTNRSIQTTAKQMNREGYRTPSGAEFNTSTTRLVLKNPIYCTADQRSYDYFINHDGNVFGDLSEFDSQHGLSVYNKTEQEKYEDSDSTFISPKFIQTVESKPISEWIIAVGKHEGFIPSDQWIEIQELLNAIAEKYNRPHRKTNALLAGLVHCPICGKRLNVVSESNRWTNGKPRFKYVCPGYRRKTCNFKAVDGVRLDEFIVQQLSDLSDEDSEHFRGILEIKVEEVLEQSNSAQEYTLLKKKKEKLQADIIAQTKNMREVNESIRCYLQEDIQNMSVELRETERLLFRLDENRKNSMVAIRDLEQTKERLLSFAEYAKDAQPEVLVTLIRSIVERIYIVDKDDERYCHIFIKGCTGEDYTGFFQTAGYIEQNTTSACDSEQDCICNFLPVNHFFLTNQTHLFIISLEYVSTYEGGHHHGCLIRASFFMKKGEIFMKFNMKKLAAAAMLAAVSVIFSAFAIPVGASKCLPVQHLVNVICAVTLGPFYGVMAAFCTSVIRNIMGTGTLLAFPGSMVGALLAGVVYSKAKKIWCACVGEVIGTGIIGGILCYPIAVFILGKEAALFTYVMPFFISTFGGSVIAAVILYSMQKTGALKYIKNIMDVDSVRA